MDATTLSSVLPAFRGERKMISKDQDVKDIMKEILDAHKAFARDYDNIASYFIGGTPLQIAKKLFNFCKKNIPYKIEPVSLQTTRSPGGILNTAKLLGGDCKHYASFIGGVLDAISRITGQKIDWWYRFASYDIFSSAPQHVFVVLRYKGQDYWVDPVLEYFDDRDPSPSFSVDKQTDMALMRISGPSQYPSMITSEVVVTRQNVSVSEPCTIGAAAYRPSMFSDKQIAPWLIEFVKTSGVQWLMNGNSINNVILNMAEGNTLTAALTVTYPDTYLGRKVPALPRPVVVGNRLVLLPKIIFNTTLKADDNFWLTFLISVLFPLVRGFSKVKWITSNSSIREYTDIDNTILYDMDNVDVIDYITGKPTVVPATFSTPPGVEYWLENGTKWVFPPDNQSGKVPPKMPVNFKVTYPKTYMGFPVPIDLPKPVNINGQLHLFPYEYPIAKLKENDFLWNMFITGTLTPIINCYCQYPYAFNDNHVNRLGDRVWDYLTGNVNPITGSTIFKSSNIRMDFLTLKEVKTFVGNIISDVGEVLVEVKNGILKIVGVIPRTAFILLVRLNVRGFATALKQHRDQDINKLKNKWENLGGSWADLNDALEDGSKKPAILSGYHVGEMTVAAALAAAAPIIAALAAFLRHISPDVAKIVDGAIDAMNAVLIAAGEDPLQIGATGDFPVRVIDPVTGQVITVNPPPNDPTMTTGLLDIIKANPIPSALIAGGLIFGLSGSSNKRRR